jgi:protein kinase A
LDSYAITRTLGTGSFGRVLLAQTKDGSSKPIPDDYKAIKIISKDRVIKTRQVRVPWRWRCARALPIYALIVS